MYETTIQYRWRLIRSFFQLGIGYINPWSHFFRHPIVFELWDSFHQNNEGFPNDNGSDEMDTLMQFADDGVLVPNDGSGPESEVDPELETLLLSAQSRSKTKKQCLKPVGHNIWVLFL